MRSRPVQRLGSAPTSGQICVWNLGMGRLRGRSDIFTITAAGITDVGKVRGYNEDAVLLADLTAPTRFVDLRVPRSLVGPLGFLFAVCDGMGGAAAGEVASSMAVEHIFDHFSEVDLPPENHDELATQLTMAVEGANHKIFRESSQNSARSGMGTTLTGALLHENLLLLAQVGDSRAYVLRRGELTQVTEDQSLVNQLLASGDLIPEDLPTFKYTNVILQALGTSAEVFVELSYVELCDGDRVLLCSDGLTGMLGPSTIATILEMGDLPEETCSTLVQRANAAGGQDNISAIVVHFDATQRESPARATKVTYQKYRLPGELSEVAWDTLAAVSLKTVCEDDFFRSQAPTVSVPRRQLPQNHPLPETSGFEPKTDGTPLGQLLFLVVLFAFVFLVIGVLVRLLG